MSDLRSALLGSGLVSDDRKRMLQAEADLAEIRHRAAAEGARREADKLWGILQTNTDPRKVRAAIRKIFLALEQPDRQDVQRVLDTINHQALKPKKNKGGSVLIAQLYELRDAVEKATSQEEKTRLVHKFKKK